jgi:hypothetical protein
MVAWPLAEKRPVRVGIRMENQIKAFVGRRMQAVPARNRDIRRLEQTC